jgi:transcriptional regulator GlxA family with amidase domain
MSERQYPVRRAFVVQFATTARANAIVPRDVLRTIDYILANLAQPIALADLVRASGVAGRTLLKHFRDCKGASPMRYVRDLRLQRVRDELLSGKARTVNQTALRWGFTHLGRFAAEYRRRFGEYPTATRARAKSA